MRRAALWTGILAAGASALIATTELIRAQAPVVADAAFRVKAFATHRAMTQASPYKALTWQWIGPANNTGRMTSMAVADVAGKRTIYVGAATGGVWKSDDRGDSWKPIFEQEATASIGDVAVAPSNANIVWVGTGEDNLFRAGIAGTGIYRSTNAGATWAHMGLIDTGTIGRILVHPTNPDVVYVAASGHEWTSNADRGVYKTGDGGKTWTKVFFRSPKTGAIDLVMDPSDPNTLYAAMCQRVRRLWSDPRVEPGDNEGGVWKTTDAGKTWTAINDGLPAAEFRGRIGVDISRSKPNTIYAIIDNYDAGRPARPNENDAYNRPLPKGSNIIRGLEVYRSDNKGQSWKKVSGQTPETALTMMGLGNTYSWVFTQIRVDPKNENTVYILALSVSVSHDGGFTMTDDLGVTRKNARDIHGTQFYNVEVDNMTPPHVYGSVQDTGSHRVALDLSKGIDALKPLDWEGAPGGEGSNQAIDPVEPNIVYSHGFYGQFTRTDLTPQPPPPSAAPDPITATGGNAQVTVEWAAVPDATGYHVFRGTGGSWTTVPLARVSGKAYRDGGLSNGTAYSYRVTAFNGGGDGPFSTTVTATPLSAPTGLAAAAGDTRVTLSWNAAAGATGYTLYRGTSSSISVMTPVAADMAALTFVDTGLTNGTRYYYRVRTQSGTLVSAPSSAVSAKPLPPPPQTPPANLTATGGNAQVILTWSPVDGVLGYRIFRSTTGVWDASPIASTTRTTYKNTGLTNGTRYSYKVAAYNQGGTGPRSDEVAATPLAPPPAPTDPAASAGDAQVTLTWTTVPEASSYKIYRGTQSNLEARVPVAAGLVSPPFVDRGVVNGPTYFYQVTAVNAGGESPRSREVSATPEGPPPTPDPATVAAFQFLRQATWGPRPGDVDAVKSLGADAFLASQFSAPASEYPGTLFNMPTEAAQERFMANALTGQDQLRQRVAWALHKIWVVSAVEVTGAPAIVTYHRLLLNGAFGNYRDLMRDVTLNPAMGRYLNMLNNRSQAITGTPPNENYARELMQLFTVGIPMLNQNGTPMTVGGRQVPVYTEQDVRALARIFTGWTFGDGNPATTPRNLASENYTVPMEAVARFHDTGAKTFLGQDFLPDQTARQDLDHALDLLFNHPNVGPFVSRQLIQQLVTSNPSPAYIAAVAAIFNNNGGGTRGDIAAVVRAILTNSEATVSTTTSGKLAEPALFVVSTLRALNASVTDHPFMSDKAESMGQKVFYPGSVFSYFSPGYRVRGTSGGGGAPLGGPEFQILTTVTALERANFVGTLIAGGFGADVAIDYTPFTSRAADPAALVDYCSLVFMGGRMSLEERTEIIDAVRVTPGTDPAERVRSALYLTLTAAQAQVDR